MPTPASTPLRERLFHERRAVPWWWWVVALGLAVPTVEAVVVLGPEMTTRGSWALGGVSLVITVGVVAALLLSLSRSDVDVDQRGLHADRASLAADAIGRVRVLDRATARTILGRDARADAHLSIRPWVHTAVQVEVVDAGGRTPYWVVGTRRPDQLATVLSTLAARYRGDELAHHEKADT